jgi:ABC-2 type transport system ATP-binding protein
MPIIELKDITKTFEIYKRKPGVLNALKSLVSRKYETKSALKGISFSIERGEMVGYIGPNGAGKSTTIKILSGILVPSSGSVVVNGLVPYKNRKKNALRIGVVFGQRTHLHWDLPVTDSYDLYQKMYRVDKARFRRNVEFFTEKLAMRDFINKPVRQLSLGQKMRAEIASALLHDPDIIYLDEPTIGLDVLAKSWIREFLREVNRERQTTVILTTHDMDDIEQICDRLVMIDNGSIIHDGSIDAFKKAHGNECELLIDFESENVAVNEPRLKLLKAEGVRRWYRFNKDEISLAEAVTMIMRNHSVKDFSYKEPEIETIVKRLYEMNMKR